MYSAELGINRPTTSPLPTSCECKRRITRPTACSNSPYVKRRPSFSEMRKILSGEEATRRLNSWPRFCGTLCASVKFSSLVVAVMSEGLCYITVLSESSGQVSEPKLRVHTAAQLKRLHHHHVYQHDAKSNG